MEKLNKPISKSNYIWELYRHKFLCENPHIFRYYLIIGGVIPKAKCTKDTKNIDAGLCAFCID